MSTYIPGEDELLHKKSQKLLIYLCLIVQQVVKEHVDNVGAGPLVSGKDTHMDVEQSFKTCQRKPQLTYSTVGNGAILNGRLAYRPLRSLPIKISVTGPRYCEMI